MRARTFGFVWAFLVIVMIFQSTPVAATRDIQWSDGDITVLRDVPSTLNVSSQCSTYIQPTFIPELGRNEDLCMFGDASMRFATFFDEAGHRKAMIGRPYDVRMHELHSVCNTYSCQYSAVTDVLVTHQRIGPESIGVVVYKHVSDRLKTTVTQSGQVIYTIDTTEPDFELRVPGKEFIWAPYFAISNNGQWLAVELHGNGIVQVNIDDLSVRQISEMSFQYGHGHDPSVELTVSNDGNRIVTTGVNAGFTVYDVTPECGQPLKSGLRFDLATISCVSTDLQLWTQFYGVEAVRQPRFNDEGSLLEVVIGLWADPPRLVTFGEGVFTDESDYEYIALGDSFVSGEGELRASDYFDPTNRCHASRRAYPFLVGAISVLPSIKVGSVACAGARISDITNTSSGYKGQNTQIPVGDITDEQRERVLTNLTPGSISQKSFVAHYQPKAVSIGIGGNDAGLMGKLRTCAMPGTCEWAMGEGLHKIAGEIQRLYDKLVYLYTDLVRAARDTRFYAVGYPNIITQDGTCDPVTDVLFDYTERVFMRESVHYLNDVIEAAAHTVGIGYIDIERSLDGKELCSGGISTAMNALRLGDDIAPLSVFPDLKVIGSESFHPSPTGHALIASFITRAHPDITSEDYCGNGQLVCPARAEIPGLSSYWSPSIVDDPVAPSFFEQFASVDLADTRTLNILVDTDTFQKSSSVSVEIRSNPTVLRTFQVDEDGSIEGTVALPNSVKTGVHTLHLFGLGSDGKPIDVYQFVEVIGDSSGDLVLADTSTNATIITHESKQVTSFMREPQLLQDLIVETSAQNLAPVRGVLGDVAKAVATVPTILENRVKHTVGQASDAFPWLLLGIGVPTMILVILLILRWVKPIG